MKSKFHQQALLSFLLLLPQGSECVLCGVYGLLAATCSLCPELDPKSCTSPDCSWMKHTQLCRDSFRDDIRTASVHLVYDRPFDVFEPAWWFQKLIVKGTSEATSFSTNGQNFGYGSVQQTSKEPFQGRVLFSISDGCDDHNGCDKDKEEQATTVACGTGMTCQEFRGKSGQMSFFDTEELPKVDDPYYFVTRADPVAADKVQYSAFFYAEVLGGWKFLSTIEISTMGKRWWHGGMLSTVEQYAPVDAYENREGLFGPTFMSDLTNDATGSSFYQIPSAYFSFGLLENHEHINAWVQDGAVGIQTGGDATQTVSKWTKFEYPPAERPRQLLDFAAFIPCLNNAKTTLETEKCLKEKNDESTQSQ